MAKAEAKGKPVTEAEDVISVTDAREQLAELVNRALYQRRRTVLTRRERPVAILIPADAA